MSAPRKGDFAQVAKSVVDEATDDRLAEMRSELGRCPIPGLDPNPFAASKARYFDGLPTDDSLPSRRARNVASYEWLGDPDFHAYCEYQTPIPVLAFQMGCHG